MFERRILHHGSDPGGVPALLHDRCIAGCWFELHRRGGCGAGEIVLRDEFPARGSVEIGDWISCEAAEGERWYLGRVEERRATSPAEVRLRLEGMGVELSEVFPGGFAFDVDGAPPHRFAATDLFPNDPDRSLETWDSIDSADALLHLLMERYVLPATHVQYDPLLIEPPRFAAPVTSIKFRGEESVAAIVKELGLRAQASWGVDAAGRMFFLQQRPEMLATWREGRDLTALHETRDREFLFNRVLLTGDYVYDHRDGSDDIARRSFRWRGNYTQPESRATYGDRRIRLWIPWLRTQSDSLAFVREFFRVYSRPTARFLIETQSQSMLPVPWNGRMRLEDRDGAALFTGAIESIRVAFDHAPGFRLELGPEDPRNLWPEPPHDERWELPDGPPPGGGVSLTSQPPLTDSSIGGSSASGGSSPASTGGSTGHSSLDTSAGSGPVSSMFSSAHSGSDLSPGTSDASTMASSDETSALSSNSESETSHAASSDSLSNDLSSDDLSSGDTSSNGSVGGSTAVSSVTHSLTDMSDSDESGSSAASSGSEGSTSDASSVDTGGSSHPASSDGPSEAPNSSTASGSSDVSELSDPSDD